MKTAQAAAKEAAMRSLKSGELNPELVIARAILAERERCAKIAERYCRPVTPKGDGESLEAGMHRLGVELGNAMSGIIAQAIRSSHE
jgi:hypothetical protein